MRKQDLAQLVIFPEMKPVTWVNSRFSMCARVFLDLFQELMMIFLMVGDMPADNKVLVVTLLISRSIDVVSRRYPYG